MKGQSSQVEDSLPPFLYFLKYDIKSRENSIQTCSAPNILSKRETLFRFDEFCTRSSDSRICDNIDESEVMITYTASL